MRIEVVLVADVVNIHEGQPFFFCHSGQFFVKQLHLGINILTGCQILKRIRNFLFHDCQQLRDFFLDNRRNHFGIVTDNLHSFGQPAEFCQVFGTVFGLLFQIGIVYQLNIRCFQRTATDFFGRSREDIRDNGTEIIIGALADQRIAIGVIHTEQSDVSSAVDFSDGINHAADILCCILNILFSILDNIGKIRSDFGQILITERVFILLENHESAADSGL